MEQIFRRLPRTRALAAALVSVVAIAACGDQGPTGIAPRPGAPRLSTTAGSTGGIVISQVYGGGGNTGATYTNDFVELHNNGSDPVDITNWSVQYASASGTTWGNRTNLSGTIAAGAYLLVRLAAGTTVLDRPLPLTPDLTGSINLSGTDGKVALVRSTTALIGGCPTSDASVVDFVGYGNADCGEGAGRAPRLSNALAALRGEDGCKDDGNNATDFTSVTPAPRNSASPVKTCVTAPPRAEPPTVTGTTPASGAADVPLDANLIVTFSKPVTASGEWFAITCTTSGALTATATVDGASFVLDPATNFTAGETCTVTVRAAQVTDQGTPPLSMAADYSWSFTTVAPPVGDPCTQTYTPIFTIQGEGATTLLVGQAVTTRGVVVADFEGAQPALRGFYVQDEQGDGKPETSDAVFVFNNGADEVMLGDVVRVSGLAQEIQGQTQIGGSSSVTLQIVKCGTGTVAPTDVTLPVASADVLERYEGMLVRFPQTLSVTEHFQLGRFGQVTLSSRGRLPQPTSVATPGAAALAVQAQNNLNRIILDDETNGQNRDPIVFGRDGMSLSASNTLRGGDQATGIVGVLTYTWGGNSASPNAYRVRTVGTLGGAVPSFQASNPRPTSAPAVGGTLRVAAMNLLNYFNTFTACSMGVGGATSTSNCRGANSQTEFDRQWAKTVAAVRLLDPDVLGVNEIENDGYGAESAIAHLVERLNAAMGAGTYAYVDVDSATAQVNALGTDAIKVGVIYKPARVKPVGTTGALNSVDFVNGGDNGPRNRAALAQAFEQPNGARFVVSVNHLKSKGSACSAPDAGDGQGNCNLVRARSAQLLAEWLASDPTGTGDPDVLIMGDLNSYAKEDPITALRNAGYTNLVESRLGANAYSYAFDGQWGYLDHALASRSLDGQVTGVAEWHINADEPAILDYNVEFKSPGHVASLYAPDQFRVSDHDPVVVGLNLTAPAPPPPPPPTYTLTGFLAPVANAPLVNEVKAGSAIPVKFSLGGDEGLDILAAGYPVSRPSAACSGAAVDPITAGETVSAAGQSGLSYDPATGVYTFVWKTERSWTSGGGCRELVLRLKDGTQKTALFRFTR